MYVIWPPPMRQRHPNSYWWDLTRDLEEGIIKFPGDWPRIRALLFEAERRAAEPDCRVDEFCE